MDLQYLPQNIGFTIYTPEYMFLGCWILLDESRSSLLFNKDFKIQDGCQYSQFLLENCSCYIINYFEQLIP